MYLHETVCLYTHLLCVYTDSVVLLGKCTRVFCRRSQLNCSCKLQKRINIYLIVYVDEQYVKHAYYG